MNAGLPIELSVVLPSYNEEESVRPLYDAVLAGVAPLNCPFEIVFVDDGSRDSTFARMAEIAAEDPRVRVVKFRRNHGQTVAMVAGIDHARGRIIVTMDSDLQNDPADIPELVAKIDEGFDLVVGWRRNRQDKFLTRKVPSVIANWLIGRVTGIPIRDNGCSLKAYRSDVIKQVPLYSELHRFIPAMASLTGARIAQIPVRHHARRFGSSKYGLSRTYRVLLDLFTVRTILSFAARPLARFGLLACVTAVVATLCGLRAVFGVMAQDDASMLAFLALAMLLGSLSLYLLLLGALAYLVYLLRFDPHSLSRIAAARGATLPAPAPGLRDRPA